MSLVALSELLGATVRDASGTVRGRVREIAVAPQDHPTRVAYLIVRTPDGERVLPADDAQVVRRHRAHGDRMPHAGSAYTPSDGVLLLKRDLLDQQIIDVHGRKVVRVNDVEIESTPVNSHVAAERRRGRRRRARRDPPALARASSRRSRCARCSRRFRRASSRGSSSICSRPIRRAASS